MESAPLYPHYVAVAIMAVNPRLAQLKSPAQNEKVLPISLFVLENEDDIYELPSVQLQPADDSLKECAARAMAECLGEDFASSLTGGLQEVKTYLVPPAGHSRGYMVTAFETTLVPESEDIQLPKGKDKGANGRWRALNAMQFSFMKWNHNEVIEEIVKTHYDKAPLTVRSCVEFLASQRIEKSKTRQYGSFTRVDGTPWDQLTPELGKEQRDTFIRNLQDMGFNIYPHMHMEVATDVVAFGYHDDGENEDGLKDEEPTNELSVLLVKRADDIERGAGKWALPGCFLKGEETAEEAARRSLLEESGLEGLKPSSIIPLRPFTAPDRDTEEGVPVISLPYFWITNKVDVKNYKQSKSTVGCAWFPVKRTLYGGHGQESEVKLRFDNTVMVPDGKGGYRKDTSTSQRPTVLKENGIPVTDVYIKKVKVAKRVNSQTQVTEQDCLFIDYFVSEKFETRNSVGGDRLAFDHDEIIVAAFEAMREQTHFKPLIGGLLPDTFSPTMFRRLWEAFLWPWTFGRSNFEGNIRKKGIIVPTEDSQKVKGASFYTFSPEKFNELLEDNISILKGK